MNGDDKRFSIKERLASFKHAFAGLKSLLFLEHNSRVHTILAILAITLGVVLNISLVEWLIIVVVIGLVFVTELLNSAIENLSDVITRDFNERIKRSKDYSAAAVLVSSFVALVAGVLIFGPKILKLFF